MTQKYRDIYNAYPSQFWLMTVGLLIMSAGSSMIWPFLMIYVKGKLSLSLSAAGFLVSINAGIGLFASLGAGAVADKLGRKPVMVTSLLLNGMAYFFMSRAETYTAFAFLMVLTGISNPLYAVGADAMLADLLPSEKRTDGYAIIRMVNNAGIAIGPALGGFAIGLTGSYSIAFFGAATGMFTYGLLILFLANETLDRTYQIRQETASASLIETFAGFFHVFKDIRYMAFTLLVALGLIAPSLLWNLLAVYSNENFAVTELMYGWIPTTNALMCVFIQFPVTNITRRYRPLKIVAIGMLVYALGVGSVALMAGFWGFWLSMVIMTFGELILVPTASKYVADQAPPNLRGRYMSVYWLSQGLARTIAPLYGGFLNDKVSPQSIWLGGLTVGLISSGGLFALSNRTPQKKLEQIVVE
jgi:MFS family permease